MDDVEYGSFTVRDSSPSRDSLKGTLGDYQFRKYNVLHRTLLRKHITSIAFSGTVGIGLFVTSGELIGLGGSLGCCLSFLIAGIIVLSVMRSLAELVSVNPCAGALMKYPEDYVDKALGFAVGVVYWLSQCASMAVLTAAAARVANNFNPTIPLTKAQRGGIIAGFCIATLLSNALGVRLYGNLERGVKWIKLITIISLCVLMVLVNLRVGVPCPQSTQFVGTPESAACHHSTITNYSQNAITPIFNVFGFNTTTFNGNDANGFGVPGAGGRFLAVWTCITLAVFACMGGDIVVVTAGEAKFPRKDLPAAARFMYMAPLSFYVLASFLVGLNVNYADPELFRPYINAIQNFFPSPSPFIIALKRITLAPNVLPTVLNALFMFSAYTAANTALFASSRTLFSFSQMHGPDWMRDTLGRTSNGKTPHAAILVSSAASLLAFLGLADVSFNQPILNLSSFFTGAVGCVYISECIAYIRFFQGFKVLDSAHVPSRDGKEYTSKCYRSHWQPAFAWIGLVGCSLIVSFTGWPAIYIMSARDKLRDGQGPYTSLRSNHRLAGDIVGAYSGVIIFVVVYLARKFWPGKETHIKTFREYENKYRFSEFDSVADFPADPRGLREWIREIWSFIK